MPTADPAGRAAAIGRAEAARLFSGLETFPALVLAVSGGPDSTALLILAARWRAARKRGPKLHAVTVDHGLRPEAAQEARAVARLARTLAIPHRILRWTGRKPRSGLQEAARLARYRLLVAHARKVGAGAILAAHTRDDQAETVLMRLLRGSGVAGLAAMGRVSALPTTRSLARGSSSLLAGKGRGEGVGASRSAPPHPAALGAELLLVRPLLEIPKSRLIATLRVAKIPFAEDPSNANPRFTRVRLRSIMEQLAGEGLSAARLALFARRTGRASQALEAATDDAEFVLTIARGPTCHVLAAVGFFALPEEIGLRLAGRLIGRIGGERPVELAKLESLYDALVDARKSARPGRGAEPKAFRRTLAGAMITADAAALVVERAPERRKKARKRGGRAQMKA